MAEALREFPLKSGALMGERFADMTAEIAARAEAAETAGLAEDMAALHGSGLLAACLPRAMGGEGLGQSANAAERIFDILRGLGRANLSVGRLYEGHVNALKLVQLYGDADVQAHMAEQVRNGALLGVWGADGARPVRFRKDGNDLILDGQKQFASGLGLVRFAVVSLREQGEEAGPVRLALVEVGDTARQDAASWRAAGMRATRSGSYDFTAVLLAEGQLLGAAGDYEREPFFEGGIWRYCAVHLGGAEALIDHWRVLLEQRGRGDDPFQISRLARAVGQCRALEAYLRKTALLVEQVEPQDRDAVAEVVVQALLARQFTEDSCVEILTLAEKSLGTSAHMAGPVERIRRDLSLFIRQAAPDAKLLKAGQLLLAHSKGFAW